MIKQKPSDGRRRVFVFLRPRPDLNRRMGVLQTPALTNFATWPQDGHIVVEKSRFVNHPEV